MKKLAKSLFGVVAGLSVAATGIYAPVFADEAEEPRKIVAFVDEGTLVSQQIVYDGDCLYEPEALGKDGYVFRGWFDGEEEADFWTCDQTVSEDLETKTYTAKYDKADLRVNFMASEDRLGATVFSSQQVAEGGAAAEPTDTPERAGYEVSGWEDKDGNEFDFSTAVTENIDLYPIFSPAETTYKVFIYKENEDDEGEYKLVDDDELTGLTGSEISLSEDEINAYLSGLKNGAYYTLDKTEGDTTVKADGTSAVKVYFKRRSYDLVFDFASNRLNLLRFLVDGERKEAGYTISGVKIGQTIKGWPSGIVFGWVDYPFSGWNVENTSTYLRDPQTIVSKELLGDGTKTKLNIRNLELFEDLSVQRLDGTTPESDEEIELEENEAKTDPVYVIVQVQYIDYDYSGVPNIHTDEYKFVRGEGGLALVPGYTGKYPEDSDSFVGWTPYDNWDLPYQSHHTSADYFFENGLINVDAFAEIFCESEDEDCTLRFFAAFDYEPEDGWFQEIEEEIEEEVEEEEIEEENPVTLDNISSVVVVAMLAVAGLVGSLVVLKKKEA